MKRGRSARHRQRKLLASKAEVGHSLPSYRLSSSGTLFTISTILTNRHPGAGAKPPEHNHNTAPGVRLLNRPICSTVQSSASVHDLVRLQVYDSQISKRRHLNVEIDPNSNRQYGGRSDLNKYPTNHRGSDRRLPRNPMVHEQTSLRPIIKLLARTTSRR